MGNNLSKNLIYSHSLNTDCQLNYHFIKNNYHHNMKLKSGAMQGEFGEKKFIKP